MSDSNIFFPEPKIVQVKEQDTGSIQIFKITEFVFENRLKFLRIVGDIFRDLLADNPDFKTTGNYSQVAASFIELAGERLGDIYCLVLNKDIEWVKKNITLRNEIEILTAIFEVNDIPFLVRQVTSLMSKASK